MRFISLIALLGAFSIILYSAAVFLGRFIARQHRREMTEASRTLEEFLDQETFTDSSFKESGSLEESPEEPPGQGYVSQ